MEDPGVDGIGDHGGPAEHGAHLLVGIPAVAGLEHGHIGERAVDRRHPLVSAVGLAAVQRDRSVHAVDHRAAGTPTARESLDVEIERIEETSARRGPHRVRLDTEPAAREVAAQGTQELVRAAERWPVELVKDRHIGPPQPGRDRIPRVTHPRRGPSGAACRGRYLERRSARALHGSAGAPTRFRDGWTARSAR